MTRPLTDTLCTKCGLCCDGTLFADVELVGQAEAARLEIMGLEVDEGDRNVGLLSQPDAPVRLWGERLQTDLPCLLRQFQDLFHQDEGEDEPVLSLNREFLSDNVIRLLRDAMMRAHENDRTKITPMDLLICMLTASRSIVAECFERLGVTAAKLTEQAVIAEYARRDERG